MAFIPNEGACPYCGQTVMIETSSKLDEATLERAVLARCMCERAVTARHREKTEEQVDRICGKGAREFGFKPLTDAALSAMCEFGYALFDHVISNAVFMADGDRIRMRIKDGTLWIQRKSEKAAEV